MTTTDNKVVKAPAERVQRKPIGLGSKLEVRNKQPGFEYRIVNASRDPGRIEMFKDAGYEVAVDGESVNGKVFNGAQPDINLMGGDKGVLMKIKTEYFEEDKANKLKAVNATEQQINREAEESMMKFREKGGLRST